jgi:nucleoside-diphosphate-sugar epimerase
MNLEGKFATVTGGGSGIGLAITKALRAAGSDVLIVGRNETRLNAARGDDSRILTVAADLANPDDRGRLIEQLSSGRPLDILVIVRPGQRESPRHSAGALDEQCHRRRVGPASTSSGGIGPTIKTNQPVAESWHHRRLIGFSKRF